MYGSLEVYKQYFYNLHIVYNVTCALRDVCEAFAIFARGVCKNIMYFNEFAKIYIALDSRPYWFCGDADFSMREEI
jgi:hypothetical protein